MRIHALTACVDYADLLAVGASRWASGLASWTIATAERDVDTRELAATLGARVHMTETWWADGASFNKGRAMEESRQTMPWEDWILLLDADVVPPVDWLALVERAAPVSGHLYGAVRHECADPTNLDPLAWPTAPHDGVGVGFFQLFHSQDPAAQAAPLLTSWQHAGNYDNVLMDRWRRPAQPHDMRRLVDGLRLCHLGERDNWFGRARPDRRERFDAMQAERKRRGGDWQHERVG